MSLDDAYCADGCGRLAETERPTADGRREEVCLRHADWDANREGPTSPGQIISAQLNRDHATLEDR